MSNGQTMSERKNLESILLENKIVSEEQLQQVVRYAQSVGIDLHEAVLQQKTAAPEAVMMAYAESVGLPFVHFDEVAVDESIIQQIDSMTARQFSLIPVSVDEGYVQLATTKPVLPDVAEKLRLQFNLPVRCVICTPTALNTAIATYYPRDAVKTDRTETSVAESLPKKPAPAPKVPTEPMDERQKNDRLKLTIIAFNFSFAIVFFFLVFFQFPKQIYFSGYHTPFAVFVSAAAAGVICSITWKKLTR